MKSSCCFLVLILSMLGTSHAVAAPGFKTVLPLSYGISTFDISGTGISSYAVLARRENYNAHSFDVLTLYVNVPVDADAVPFWQLVPVFDKDKENLELHEGGGADCVLHDFRLFTRESSKEVQLVLAVRDMGDSYANTEPVEFRFYSLRTNVDRDIGRPPYYFQFFKSIRSKLSYCDVGEAFKTELGLGPYMRRDHLPM